MDPMVRHLLDISVHQGQMFQELAHSLHTITQEHLRSRQSPGTATVPLTDPACDALRLLTKLNVDDDIDAFLKMFERVAEREGW